MQILISCSESSSTHPNFKQIISCQVVHQFCPNSLLSHESGKADPPPHLILPLYSVLLILLACFSIFLMLEEWSCKVLPPFQEEELHWGGISNGRSRIKYGSFPEAEQTVLVFQRNANVAGRWLNKFPFPLPSKIKLCENTGIIAFVW